MSRSRYLSLLPLLVLSLSIQADMFDDHMTVLCRSTYPSVSRDDERVIGLLKTPYIFLNRAYPNDVPRYSVCANQSPLYMVLRHGSPLMLKAMLGAGASAIVTTDLSNPQGKPLTEAQNAIFAVIWGSQGPQQTGTEMIDKFRIYWAHLESTRGVPFVQAQLAATNGGGKNALQWLCTQQPNPGFGNTWWNGLKNNEAQYGWKGGREIVAYLARHLGSSDAATKALCPGWVP